MPLSENGPRKAVDASLKLWKDLDRIVAMGGKKHIILKGRYWTPQMNAIASN